MKKIIFLLALIPLLITSCATTGTTKYTVASQRADCVGVGPQKCLLVKKGDAADWRFFYSRIEGFDYEPGYEYVLKVKEEKRKNVPMDASSIKYTLVKEVSKVKKTSENLPPDSPKRQRNIQCSGKVLDITSKNIGTGAAAGKFEVTIVKIWVTSSTSDKFKEGDTIHCELIASPRTKPVIGREYMFKAESLHPAHAKGVYLLDTDVLDLTR